MNAAPGVTEAPPNRLLLGPGPSLVHPRVLQALGLPPIGHLDPAFLTVLDEVQQLLRDTFRTSNPLTFAISGTGSAGMEAAIANVIEPDDTAVIGVNGAFGARLAEMVQRCGGRVSAVEAPWGSVIELDALRMALSKAGRVKMVGLVHAETSTGASQPLDGVSDLCRRYGALLLVDAVTSLAGMPVEVDAWGIDLCYSGTQKCLSCPPGLAPITVSPRALEVIRRRKTPCRSWYFDLMLVADYWTEGKRVYHHTAPISMLYGLREALRLVHEEGLAARFARHRVNSMALAAGLSELGLLPLPAEEHRLPMLSCIRVPSHLEDAPIREALLLDHGIEIGGGLGPLKGQVWRIGFMGESSQQAHVLTFLNALEEGLARSGRLPNPGIAVQAAVEAFRHPPQSIRSPA
ncbi:MAG TPA: alanine--glyoxylate aminotransferase family protein [Nitrospiraceae bacterium]|nr:alanine--glyoxylate aminotransferase family protein [Nitrospiraceae bacterium]